MEKACAVAGVAGARAVEMQAVATVFFALVSTLAALEDVEQLHVEADCSIGLAEHAAGRDEVRPACPEPLGCCTLTAPVGYRHSRWQLGVLG